MCDGKHAISGQRRSTMQQSHPICYGKIACSGQRQPTLQQSHSMCYGKIAFSGRNKEYPLGGGGGARRVPPLDLLVDSNISRTKSRTPWSSTWLKLQCISTLSWASQSTSKVRSPSAKEHLQTYARAVKHSVYPAK